MGYTQFIYITVDGDGIEPCVIELNLVCGGRLRSDSETGVYFWRFRWDLGDVWVSTAQRSFCWVWLGLQSGQGTCTSRTNALVLKSSHSSAPNDP